MQRDRGVREESINSGGFFDSFGSFGGFGPERSMMSSIFGGRDPFDVPFFRSPFSSAFGSSMFNSGSSFVNSPPQVSSLKGPVIEELLTDDEEEEKVDDTSAKEEKAKAIKNNKHPLVEHPDDKVDERKNKDVLSTNDNNNPERTNPRAQCVSFQKVTCGGINGAYYTASTSRKSSSDGVVLEECRQADRTTGQAAHRLSRGIHDQGHSVTRKLNSDGKVDTMQTLHNLNEDELAGFEQAWKGNAERHLPGWDDGFNSNLTAGASGWAGRSNLALPFEGFSGRPRGMGAHNEARTSSSGGRPKKVVTINIE